MARDAELDQPKLKRGFRGYDPKEVDRWMQDAAETLEGVLADNAQLQQVIERQKIEIERLRRDDHFIQDALITAQKSADEIRLAAQRHAAMILDEARQTGAEQFADAVAEAEKLRQEIDSLRAHRKRFIDDFRLILEKSYEDLKVIAYGEDA
jgi:cell division initiation protein